MGAKLVLYARIALILCLPILLMLLPLMARKISLVPALK